MQVMEVSATFAFTKNLGNFQSMRAEATVKVVVEPGDNVQEVFDKSFIIAKENVRKQLKGDVE